MKKKQETPAEPAEVVYTMRDTLYAFQDLLVSMKLKRLSANTPLELAAALGSEDDMLKHLINLQTAVQFLSSCPKEKMKALSDIPVLASVKDGTTPFRIQNRLLEPAIAKRATTVTIDQLDEAVLVLHAYDRLNR